MVASSWADLMHSLLHRIRRKRMVRLGVYRTRIDMMLRILEQR